MRSSYLQSWHTPHALILFFGVISLSTASWAQTDSWIAKRDMPTPRWASGTCTINGKIYVIGGKAGEGQPSLATVEEYNPGLARCQRDLQTAPPQPRQQSNQLITAID